jgi:hypothetical protein
LHGGYSVDITDYLAEISHLTARTESLIDEMRSEMKSAQTQEKQRTTITARSRSLSLAAGDIVSSPVELLGLNRDRSSVTISLSPTSDSVMVVLANSDVEATNAVGGILLDAEAPNGRRYVTIGPNSEIRYTGPIFVYVMNGIAATVYAVELAKTPLDEL